MKKIKAIPLSVIVFVGLISIVMAVNLGPWTAFDDGAGLTPDIEVSGDGAFSITYDSDIVGPIVYYEEYLIVIHVTSSASVHYTYDVNMWMAITAPDGGAGVSTDQLLSSWGLGDEYSSPGSVLSWTTLSPGDWSGFTGGLGAGQKTSIGLGHHGASASFDVTFKFSVGPTTVAQGEMRFSCRIYGEKV